jgi:chromatin segregation and condensation protein Rec8/ScpA/Scc1 (kleisin family)
MEEFIIKQGRFEGPYTKLLELIENRKLSISEISLAAVTDEYIASTFFTRCFQATSSFL